MKIIIGSHALDILYWESSGSAVRRKTTLSRRFTSYLSSSN
jgi:hypothetical protein